MSNVYRPNLSLLCDFYELTMSNGYFHANLQDQITYFDVFFRDLPDHSSFAICAGLDLIIDYIKHLHFDEDDIEELYSLLKPIIDIDLRNYEDYMCDDWYRKDSRWE